MITLIKIKVKQKSKAFSSCKKHRKKFQRLMYNNRNK